MPHSGRFAQLHNFVHTFGVSLLFRDCDLIYFDKRDDATFERVEDTKMKKRQKNENDNTILRRNRLRQRGFKRTHAFGVTILASKIKGRSALETNIRVATSR